MVIEVRVLRNATAFYLSSFLDVLYREIVFMQKIPISGIIDQLKIL